jgi:hypothetical protein
MIELNKPYWCFRDENDIFHILSFGADYEGYTIILFGFRFNIWK